MQRQTILKIFAVLIIIRALTNVFKPFSPTSQFVFFGQLLTGSGPMLLAALIGIVMIVYGIAIWQQWKVALPLGVAYLVFALANLVLFPIYNEIPGGFGMGGYLAFAGIGFAVSGGAVYLLARERRPG